MLKKSNEDSIDMFDCYFILLMTETELEDKI